MQLLFCILDILDSNFSLWLEINAAFEQKPLILLLTENHCYREKKLIYELHSLS